jgi:hypothetical protein
MNKQEHIGEKKTKEKEERRNEEHGKEKGTLKFVHATTEVEAALCEGCNSAGSSSCCYKVSMGGGVCSASSSRWRTPPQVEVSRGVGCRQCITSSLAHTT